MAKKDKKAARILVRARSEDLRSLLEEDKRRYDQWQDSSLRRFLIGSFFASLLLSVFSFVYFSLPLPVEGDTTICASVVSEITEAPAADPVSREVVIECIRRGVPVWLLIAAPLTTLLPMVALVMLGPNNTRLGLRVAGDNVASLESESPLVGYVRGTTEEVSRTASAYSGVD